MKRLLVITLLFALAIPIHTNAEDLKKIRCTCYCEAGTTASGFYTREGIIAGRREDLGKVAAIYKCNDNKPGDFLGYYEFRDTGAGIDTDGDGKGDSIKKGLSVDVFRSSKQRAKDWIADNGDYVFIQLIEADG